MEARRLSGPVMSSLHRADLLPAGDGLLLLLIDSYIKAQNIHTESTPHSPEKPHVRDMSKTPFDLFFEVC